MSTKKSKSTIAAFLTPSQEIDPVSEEDQSHLLETKGELAVTTTKEQITLFIEELENDKTLQREIAKVKPGDINSICQIAKEAGFTFTVAEFKEEIESLAAREAEDMADRKDLAVGLTIATALIHVVLGTPIFILNGLGFLSLLAGHYFVEKSNLHQKYTRDAFFGYTGFTVAGYFAVKGVMGFVNPIGVASKLVELGLMRVLWDERQAADSQTLALLNAVSEETETASPEVLEGTVIM